MAQSKSSKKSQGLCEKIHNAVSPFRPRIHRISDHTIPQTKPQLALHQSKTIPVELRHSAAPQSSDDHEREIAIIRGQKFAKSPPPPPPPQHVHLAKDGDSHSVHHEGKFSDYISKFKNRMMKTASHVDGGLGNSTRRDSFNDKMSNYIDQAKIKIRTTTNVGAGAAHNNN